VTEDERQGRKEEFEAKEKGETLAKEVNRYISAAEALEKVTDDRVYKTNLFNPDNSVYLNAYDMFVYVDTYCEFTKKHVQNRLNYMKPETVKKLIDLGNKEKEKLDKDKATKRLANEQGEVISSMQLAEMNGYNPAFTPENWY